MKGRFACAIGALAARISLAAEHAPSDVLSGHPVLIEQTIGCLRPAPWMVRPDAVVSTKAGVLVPIEAKFRRNFSLRFVDRQQLSAAIAAMRARQPPLDLFGNGASNLPAPKNSTTAPKRTPDGG